MTSKKKLLDAGARASDDIHVDVSGDSDSNNSNSSSSGSDDDNPSRTVSSPSKRSPKSREGGTMTHAEVQAMLKGANLDVSLDEVAEYSMSASEQSASAANYRSPKSREAGTMTHEEVQEMMRQMKAEEEAKAAAAAGKDADEDEETDEAAAKAAFMRRKAAEAAAEEKLAEEKAAAKARFLKQKAADKRASSDRGKKAKKSKKPEASRTTLARHSIDASDGDDDVGVEMASVGNDDDVDDDGKALQRMASGVPKEKIKIPVDKDPREWVYGLIFDKPRPDSMEERRLGLLFQMLITEFGMFQYQEEMSDKSYGERVDLYPFHKTSTDDYIYLKVACSLEKLEYHAERLQIMMPVTQSEAEIYGQLYEPFLREDKMTDTFAHPFFWGDDTPCPGAVPRSAYHAGKNDPDQGAGHPMRAHHRPWMNEMLTQKDRERRAGKLSDDDDDDDDDEDDDDVITALDYNEDEANIRVCGCDLFLPYQKQVIVRHRLNAIFHQLMNDDVLVHYGVKQSAHGDDDAIKTAAVRLTSKGHMQMKKEAAGAMDKAKDDNKETHLLRHAIRLHTLQVFTKPSNFFLSTRRFTERHLGWSSALFTLFHFTQKSKIFLEYMRVYFGEKVALYFAFLHFYSSWLLMLSIVGIGVFAWTLISGETDHVGVPFYAVCVSLWSTFFTTFWRRKSSVISYRWGMDLYEHNEEALSTVAEPGQTLQDGYYLEGDWVDMSDYKAEVSSLEMDNRDRLDGLIHRILKQRAEKKGRISAAQRKELNVLRVERKLADVSAADYVPRHFRRPARRCCGVDINERFCRLLQKLVSLSTMMLLAGGVIVATLALMSYRQTLQTTQSIGSVEGAILAGVINAVVIFVLDVVYQRVAVTLNNWERYTTSTAYEDALITKIFFLQFINAYTSLFYIAFGKGVVSPDFDEDVDGPFDAALHVKPSIFHSDVFGLEVDYCRTPDGAPADNCMQELSYQLASLFITRAVIGNLLEFVGPAVKYWVKRTFRHAHDDDDDHHSHHDTGGQLSNTQSQVATEAALNKYGEEKVSGTFYDYGELAIQFGYVTLFAPAFPLASLVAVVSNVIENTTDGYKLFTVFQKPVYHGAHDIGSWLAIFRFLGVVAVITNCLIIAITSDKLESLLGRQPEVYERIFVAVFMEHVLLGLKFGVAQCFDERPLWLRHQNSRSAAVDTVTQQYDLARENPSNVAPEVYDGKAYMRSGDGGGDSRAGGGGGGGASSPSYKVANADALTVETQSLLLNDDCDDDWAQAAANHAAGASGGDGGNGDDERPGSLW